MDLDPHQMSALASLLRAELLARLAPAAMVQERYQRGARFQPSRASSYQILSQALKLASLAGDRPAAAAGTAAPVLMVCESHPFEPDLASLHDQILLRLLARLEAAEVQGWILRLRARPRPLRQQLARLPARPSMIVSIGVADQACLELLRELAPVVRLGARFAPTRGMKYVEYDAQMEAYAIASYAAAHKMEQIAFVAPITRTAGRRCISGNDVAALAALAEQAHAWNIPVPSHLTFWVDAGRDLQAAEVLPKVAGPAAPRVLSVVAGPTWARELAQAAGAAGAHIVCRHWSAEETPEVPVIGPDLEQLAGVILARGPEQDRLPPEVAVLVPPRWHRQ